MKKDTYVLIVSLQPLIKQIKKIAKHYFTMDYGQVYLNPHTMELWIVCGDGGYMYSKKSINKVQKSFENDEDFELSPDKGKFIDFHEHPSLYFLNSTNWEAENFPKEDDWYHICNISVLDY